MKKLSYTSSDGTCAILHPNYNNREQILVSAAVMRPETDVEFIARIGGAQKMADQSAIQFNLTNYDVSTELGATDFLTAFAEAINTTYDAITAKRIEVVDKPAVYRDETDDELLQRVMAKDLPIDAQYATIITDADLPYSGHRPGIGRRAAIRSAWVNPPDTTSPPTIDLDKAKSLCMDEWRGKQRDVLFSRLDVEYQKADETGDSALKTKIAIEKNRLRNFPNDIQSELDAIKTAEDLDLFNPILNIATTMDPDVEALLV